MRLRGLQCVPNDVTSELGATGRLMDERGVPRDPPADLVANDPVTMELPEDRPRPE